MVDKKRVVMVSRVERRYEKMKVEIEEVSEEIVKNSTGRSWDYSKLRAVLNPLFKANSGKQYAIKNWKGFLTFYTGVQAEKPKRIVLDSVSRCLRNAVGNKNLTKKQSDGLVFFHNNNLIVDERNVKVE